MKHYIFKDKITKESVDELLKVLTSNEDKYLIYIDTKGDENTVLDYLVYYLNLNKERFTLVSGAEITSNGLWLFYYFEGERIISSSTCSHIHQSWMNIGTYNLKDKESVGYKDYLELQKINEKWMYILKPYFSKKEMLVFEKGDDVYLSSDRIKQIIFKK